MTPRAVPPMPEPTAQAWEIRRNGRTEHVTDEAVVNAMPTWELMCRAAATRNESAVHGYVVAGLVDACDKATADAAETRQLLAEREQVWGRRDLGVWETRERQLATAEARAERAEAAIERVLDECDQQEFEARRWADPLPVPPMVDDVRRAVAGLPPSEQFIRHGRECRADVWDEIKDRRTSPGSAGQPAGLAGEDADAATSARLPADPAPLEYPTYYHGPAVPIPTELDWTAEDETEWGLRQRRYANLAEDGAR